MPIKDLLTRKGKSKTLENSSQEAGSSPPKFTFLRTDTNTQEVIRPPSPPCATSIQDTVNFDTTKRRSRLRNSSNASTTSKNTVGENHLSSLLKIRNHSRSRSANIPADLPSIRDGKLSRDDQEAQWEERATILAKENPNLKHNVPPDEHLENADTKVRPVSGRSISNAQGDDDIQEAIRLHEAGDLTESTAMFGRLADPDGENNALSQVLYGLALRHGWGIPKDPSLAVEYLSQAASNSATVESQALSSGMKRGGAAKGELVLAIYELANCFRHGWGVDKDPLAARSYYETAANLGDTDAMNEAARCYEEGFGGKRDRFAAARWYRRAEQKGNKTLGNSWIWKDKYNTSE